jgi:hypothetical protein
MKKGQNGARDGELWQTILGLWLMIGRCFGVDMEKRRDKVKRVDRIDIDGG